MSSWEITNSDTSPVTVKQREHVITLLKRFGVVAADAVEHSPKYGGIAVSGPLVSLGSLYIEKDGSHATSSWQLDNIDASLVWISPEEERTRYAPASSGSGGARRIPGLRKHAVRDEPYPTRSKK